MECFSLLTGEYGMPRKWYFPIQKSYWLGESKTIKQESIDNEMPVEDIRSKYGHQCWLVCSFLSKKREIF